MATGVEGNDLEDARYETASDCSSKTGRRDLQWIRDECARKLQQQLTDPHVRANKAPPGAERLREDRAAPELTTFGPDGRVVRPDSVRARSITPPRSPRQAKKEPRKAPLPPRAVKQTEATQPQTTVRRAPLVPAAMERDAHGVGKVSTPSSSKLAGGRLDRSHSAGAIAAIARPDPPKSKVSSSQAMPRASLRTEAAQALSQLVRPAALRTATPPAPDKARPPLWQAPARRSVTPPPARRSVTPPPTGSNVRCRTPTGTRGSTPRAVTPTRRSVTTPQTATLSSITTSTQNAEAQKPKVATGNTIDQGRVTEVPLPQYAEQIQLLSETLQQAAQAALALRQIVPAPCETPEITPASRALAPAPQQEALTLPALNRLPCEVSVVQLSPCSHRSTAGSTEAATDATDANVHRLLEDNRSLREAFDSISKRLERVEDEKSQFFDEGIFDLVNSIAGQSKGKHEDILTSLKQQWPQSEGPGHHDLERLHKENAELRQALEQANLVSEELEGKHYAASTNTEDLEAENASLMERLQSPAFDNDQPSFTHKETMEIKRQLERMRRELQRGSMECTKALREGRPSDIEERDELPSSTSFQDSDGIICSLDEQVQQLQRKLQQAEARSRSLESENALLRTVQPEEAGPEAQADLEGGGAQQVSAQTQPAAALEIHEIDEAW